MKPEFACDISMKKSRKEQNIVSTRTNHSDSEIVRLASEVFISLITVINEHLYGQEIRQDPSCYRCEESPVYLLNHCDKYIESRQCS